MLRFKELEIEGFGSVINKTLFRLDQNGLNIIRGRVGSGKTSIPSALAWCLYGITLKGSKSSILTWEELRPQGYAGCKVSTIFYINDDEYKVIRCKDFKRQIRIGDDKTKGANKLFLLKNGEPIKSDKGKVELQKTIDNLTGYSFELFKNSIVFGQKMKRIIEETGPNKKKVFEEAFEATFIKRAAENVESEKKDLDKLLQDLQNLDESYNDKLLNKKEQLKEIKNILDNSGEIIKQYKGQIRVYKKEQEEIRGLKRVDTSEIESKISKLNKEIKEIREINNEIKSKKRELEEVQEGIEELNELLNREGKTCYTCGSKLQVDTFEKMQNKLKADLSKLIPKKKKLKQYLKEHKTLDIEPLEEKLRKYEKQRQVFNIENSSIARKKNEIPLIENKIKKLQNSLDNLNIKENTKKVKVLKKEIKSLKLTVKDNNKKIKKINRSIELKLWLLKDPLSNNGLKAYLFNELLQQVNEQLIKYSDILGFRIEFGIDLSTRNKDFYQLIMLDNILIPYDDLSGGQKQLVDTSVAFAIHDVVSSIKPTNIVFLDEPFESLGMDEIEIITELVEEKAKDKSLFLITHHTGFSPLNANEILVKRGKNKETIIN